MRHLSILATLVFLVASVQAQVPSYVPADGLVGWWPFNGNADDESGNGNNGTVNGATLTSNRMGISNAAYTFNGTSDHISLNNVICNFGTSDFSFSAWQLKYDTLISGAIIGKRNSTGDGNMLILDSRPGYEISTGAGDYTDRYDFNPPFQATNTWFHTAFVRAGLSLKFYVNGLLVDDYTSPTIHDINNIAVTEIGARYSGSQIWELWHGDIDDIGTWNRALDACEIQGLYNAGNQGISPTPVSYSGLSSTYTAADVPVTLVGTPAGGVFIGPGVSGNTFDPAAAGVGTHSITYTWFDACGGFNTAGLCTTVDQGVGIGGSNLGTGGVLVYPNPNRGQFTLEVDLVGLVSLQVYDAGGRLAHSEVFQATGTKTIRNLDLSGRAKGTYTLQVRNDGGVVTQMVVVE